MYHAWGRLEMRTNFGLKPEERSFRRPEHGRDDNIKMDVSKTCV
jgi:hypothetical protein